MIKGRGERREGEREGWRVGGGKGTTKLDEEDRERREGGSEIRSE